MSSDLSAYITSPRVARHPLTVKSAAAGVSRSTSTSANGLERASSPRSPMRPVSAPRVQPTAASLSSATQPTPMMSPRTRPASASRALVSASTHLPSHVGVDTISFPFSAVDASQKQPDLRARAATPEPHALPASRHQSASSINDLCSRIHLAQQKPAAAMDPVDKAKLRAFLESWQDAEPGFRSAILFSESTFAQAKGAVRAPALAHLLVAR
ncbi:hypothetical protein PybrP1_004519 [[Pythium] brassicae (nom. inval.)]|nr:hypothetical protein PybrP1_004519 [[Pythium] brassicae (nom. inval.)]